MRYRRFSYSLWALLLGFALGLPAVQTAWAQGLNSIGLPDKTKAESQAKTDPQDLRQSLDVVIQTLENNDRRQALLRQLKSLRQTTSAGIYPYCW